MKLLVLLICVGVAVAGKPYIMGGKNVTEAGKYPHQGSLRVTKETGEDHHICGISLISSTWGVTAAHCVEEQSVSKISVRFGSNDRTKGGQVVKAKNYKMHEDHDKGAGQFPNDIAVVEFAEKVTVTNASPIPLADGSIDHAHNSDCWITGWGITDFRTFKYPEILQEAKINIYTNDECKKDWESRINPGHVCIGDKAEERGSCHGDSGGPLICKVNGRYELVGAASWVIFGCDTDYPTVYTRIGYFRKWIKDNSGV